MAKNGSGKLFKVLANQAGWGTLGYLTEETSSQLEKQKFFGFQVD
jgi:hypothetical protein